MKSRTVLKVVQKAGCPAEDAASVMASPVQSARAAGLRYVLDTGPAIRRIRAGTHFRYIDADGSPVRDPETLGRIRSLKIPPAWTGVWICPLSNGHLQATGRDARGRKQYRYHPRWHDVRDQTKYGRMVAFGERLPAIRRRVETDLALRGIPREKVLATVVRLLEVTSIRIGNGEYARANGSFGLTTLRDRHARIDGERLHFRFTGKSGKEHVVEVSDRRLARIVGRCQEIPGYELFQYLDPAGDRQIIDSSDVNAYLREITGEEFSAKDFRTWNGTVQAAVALRRMGEPRSISEAKRNLAQAVKLVSGVLGNTAAVCRKCYIHPAVQTSCLEGKLLSRMAELERRNRERRLWLTQDERVVLAFLRRSGSS